MILALSQPAPGRALVYARMEAESETARPLPPDFPYWEHVTRRHETGPSVLYIGAGWALTARHVGAGEIRLGDTLLAPEPRSRHPLLNIDGSPADALLFELDRAAELPRLPLLPIAREAPRPGEEVLLIGFGQGGDRIVQWTGGSAHLSKGVRWTSGGRKRWGTNRVLLRGEWVAHKSWLTRTFVLRFDETDHRDATRLEAHAAIGDSGGGVFVRRPTGWELAGMMISVSGRVTTPPRTSMFGDRTFVADLASYRGEILRWARSACSNEEDDDGDGLIDFPSDPGCDSEMDRDERESEPAFLVQATAGSLLALGLLALLWVRLGRRRAQRGRSTPSSTRPSSAS